MKKVLLIILSVVLLAGVLVGIMVPIEKAKTNTLSAEVEALTKAAGTSPFPTPTDKTKTHCAMQCGDIPWVGFGCVMICVTCTDEFGGGCRITIY